MSLDLCILASGSSGNCSVVRSPGGVILIDGGLGPRMLSPRLTGTGVDLDDVAAVCLTHLDRDHAAPNFLAWAGRRGVPVFCDRGKSEILRSYAADVGVTLDVRPFGDEPFEPVAGLRVDAFPLAHDVEGSHGFVLSAGPHRAGFATDLGRVPPLLIERFAAAGGLDVLALECNYCPQMQFSSNRPAFLKRRITGGHGHLSNLQAFSAVRQVLDRHASQGFELPATVALLHLSRDCNRPDQVREVFSRDARLRAPRLVLAEQFKATGWLRRRTGVPPGKQLTFEWGMGRVEADRVNV